MCQKILPFVVRHQFGGLLKSCVHPHCDELRQSLQWHLALLDQSESLSHPCHYVLHPQSEGIVILSGEYVAYTGAGVTHGCSSTKLVTS
jgi:hypothetical protein